MLRRSIGEILKNDVGMLFCRFSGLTRNNSYKSAYSLSNFYPKSSLKISTPDFVPEDPSAKFSGFIPVEKLTVTYSRSSGAGGQNVNTVNSKVDLRFKVKNAEWLSDEIREKLLMQERSRVNKDGFLIIKSELTRSQQMNLADALERLRSMIRKASTEKPTMSPETEERIRKGQIKAARQRIFEKRNRSQIKQERNADYL